MQHENLLHVNQIFKIPTTTRINPGISSIGHPDLVGQHHPLAHALATGLASLAVGDMGRLDLEAVSFFTGS